MRRADELATLLVRQHAEQIMANLPREDEWATAQRREDLAEDVRLFARKRKRNRINREAAARVERVTERSRSPILQGSTSDDQKGQIR